MCTNTSNHHTNTTHHQNFIKMITTIKTVAEHTMRNELVQINEMLQRVPPEVLKFIQELNFPALGKDLYT